MLGKDQIGEPSDKYHGLDILLKDETYYVTWSASLNETNGIIKSFKKGEAIPPFPQPQPPDPQPPDPPTPEPPQPEPPQPQPPDPLPVPTLRQHSKGLTMQIDGKTVRLRGAAGRVISPDVPGTGVWGIIDGKPSQWRGVLYVADDASSARYEAQKLSNGRYTFTNIDHVCLAGADGGPYSPALDKQGYHKPSGDPDAGDLEQWRVYDGNENGQIEAQIEQVSFDGHHFFVFPLAVEVLD
jgi:hypothetical protein